MVQRTVLKVDVSCQKCKKKILKAVSTLEGVDKIEVDVGKGTLTVTGNADPYEVIVRTRKVSKYVEVVSIGPPPAPPKQDEQKKPDYKKPADQKSEQQKKTPFHNPYTYQCLCPACQGITVVRYQEPTVSCSIL